MNYRFPKKERLCSQKNIEQLFAEGKSVSKYPLKLIYLASSLPENVPIQVGVTVPKRTFKKAVIRNRIKRLLRESYRLHKPLYFNTLETPYAFMILYLGKEIPSFDEFIPEWLNFGGF